jgi:hypothetical protein
MRALSARSRGAQPPMPAVRSTAAGETSSRQREGRRPSSIPVGPRRVSVESRPDADPLEREAERTAGHVMSATVAPRCACGGVAGADGECAACRARRLGGGSTASSARGALSGPGRPLDVATRAFFEPRLGFDLGMVRVHDDARAADLAQDVGADAYTVGRDVVFGAGRYRPASDSGRTLIAHELAHVVQQQSGRTSARIQRQARTYTFVPEKDRMTPYEVLVRMVMTARGVTEGRAIDLIAGRAFVCGGHPACRRGVRDRTPVVFTLGDGKGATQGSTPAPAPPQTEPGVAWLPEETIIVTSTAPTAAVAAAQSGAIDDYPGAREALDSPEMRRLYGLRDKYYRLYPQLRQAASLDPSADDVIAMIEVSEIVKGFDETDWTLLETRVGAGAVATDWQQLRSALSQFAGGSTRAGARAAATRRETAIAAADVAVDRPAETSAVHRLDDTSELYRAIRSVEFIEGLPKQRGQGPNPELAREQGIERELLAKADFASVPAFDEAVTGLRTVVRREAVALTLHLLKESETALISEHERYREPAERRELMKDIAASRGGLNPLALANLISRHWLLTTSKNLARALDSDNADLLGDVLIQSAETQLDNVGRCRELLADDQEVVFDFDQIIELTLEQMGIKPDSVQAKLIRDERAKPDRRSLARKWIDRVLTVLSFVPGPIGWVFRAAQFGLSINDTQSHFYQQVIAANAGTPLASQPSPGGSVVDIVLNLAGLLPGGGEVTAEKKAIAEFAKRMQETDVAVASGAATEAKLLAGAHEPPAPQPPPVHEVPKTEPPVPEPAARAPAASPSELPAPKPRKKIARPANYRDPDTGVRSGTARAKRNQPLDAERVLKAKAEAEKTPLQIHSASAEGAQAEHRLEFAQARVAAITQELKPVPSGLSAESRALLKAKDLDERLDLLRDLRDSRSDWSNEEREWLDQQEQLIDAQLDVEAAAVGEKKAAADIVDARINEPARAAELARARKSLSDLIRTPGPNYRQVSNGTYDTIMGKEAWEQLKARRPRGAEPLSLNTDHIVPVREISDEVVSSGLVDVYAKASPAAKEDIEKALQGLGDERDNLSRMEGYANKHIKSDRSWLDIDYDEVASLYTKEQVDELRALESGLREKYKKLIKDLVDRFSN